MKVYDIQVSTSMYKKPVVMVWFCGCTIHCEGCFNTHLWDFENPEAKEYSPEVLSSIIYKIMRDNNIDTVMFSGGEPFDQNLKDLYTLVKLLSTSKIISYTGYTIEEIQEKGRTACLLLDRLSCILSGKYKGSETGLQDKEFVGIKEDTDYFREEALQVVCEVIISPEKAKLLGYDTLE